MGLVPVRDHVFEVSVLGADDLVQGVADLRHRREAHGMRWRRKRVDLAERLRPYVDPSPPPEPMVDADPIRMFLFRWMIETGDPIEVVARGFGVDPDIVSGLPHRDTRVVSEAEWEQWSAQLGLDSGGQDQVLP